ncbi:MAG: penicillin-binding protein 2 [Candidatus Colwellbacteria bacterium]|nr:penicillin-binding protein 2 [Candidatus Colwellbacteria bacterium]
MGFRIGALIAVFSVAFAALGINVYKLQIKEGDYYGARAASLSPENILPPRGIIYLADKNGNYLPAAMNRDYPLIYSDNRKIDDVKETATALSLITGISAEDLGEKLKDSSDPFEPILKRVNEDQLSALSLQELKGISVAYETYRFYPFGTSASHLLGFVSIDNENPGGAYGVEARYNETLTGDNIRLTVDKDIQAQAEAVLGGLIQKFSAEGGTVIVQDPKTGAILALASAPGFNPNKYGEYPLKNFLNPAVQSVYEPGSAFKVITMAAGIDSGKITPETAFVDTGELTLNGRTIKNWDNKAHDRVTMIEVLGKSLNTGTAFAERTMGHEIFYEYLTKFRFNKETGIDLPGEVAGSIRNLESNTRDINFATASFGQGISVTPISLITAVSAIANKGVMMKPYVNTDLKPERVERVISLQTSLKVADMMVKAVDGAQVAKISGYTVAGKTGTAQIPGKGGYSDDVINSFVGFAPAYDPRFTILIKLDKPAGAPLAGLSVVPAFRDLAQFILNYYNVPPDRIDN